MDDREHAARVIIESDVAAGRPLRVGAIVEALGPDATREDIIRVMARSLARMVVRQGGNARISIRAVAS
jgi:hypothetical protein